MADNAERVQVWNSLFRFAWEDSKELFEGLNKCQAKELFAPAGGTFDEDPHNVLAALISCTLAIEARANHVLRELVEQGRLTEDVADAVLWLPPRERWFIIPALVGAEQFDSSTQPHQAIAEICALRNDVIHVKFDRLLPKLPNATRMLGYFKSFVEAMEDMNVKLGLAARTAPLPEVLAIGEFSCK